MASRSLQYCWCFSKASFSHFPKESNTLSVEKIVVGWFLLFHPSSLVTTLTIACLVNNLFVLQFNRRTWLKAELCQKCPFYYVDFIMLQEKHDVFTNIVQIYLKVSDAAPFFLFPFFSFLGISFLVSLFFFLSQLAIMLH